MKGDTLKAIQADLKYLKEQVNSGAMRYPVYVAEKAKVKKRLREFQKKT